MHDVMRSAVLSIIRWHAFSKWLAGLAVFSSLHCKLIMGGENASMMQLDLQCVYNRGHQCDIKSTHKAPQDGGSVYCCYNYHVDANDARLQNCMVCCVLRVIGCVMSDPCHTRREYPQDGGHVKKADGFCNLR